MVELIKKGGLRERANRSRKYQGSENTETTLHANRYQNTQKINPSPKDDSENNATTQTSLTTDEMHPTTTKLQK